MEISPKILHLFPKFDFKYSIYFDYFLSYEIMQI